MSTILGLILIFYCVTLWAGIVGWIRATQVKAKAAIRAPKLSVVVACRNEEQNISRLIQSLGNQAYREFELIVVDDHSTDSTLDRMNQLAITLPACTVLTLPAGQQGKKGALTMGIQHASGSIIVTTDADCVHPSGWLRTLTGYFDEEQVQMLIGPIALEHGKTFFERLQEVEYLSIISTTVSTIGWQHPVMCSGANLAIRKNVFEEVKGYDGNLHIPSGDDEFLLRKVFEKYPTGIRFMNSEEGIATTRPLPGISQFFHQRWRWAGKWKANTNLLAKTLGLLIVVSQVAYLCALYFVLLDFRWAFLIVMKILLEYFLLSRASGFIRQRFDGVAFTVLQVLYPVYVIAAGLGSMFYRPRWKGRIYT